MPHLCFCDISTLTAIHVEPKSVGSQWSLQHRVIFMDHLYEKNNFVTSIMSRWRECKDSARTSVCNVMGPRNELVEPRPCSPRFGALPIPAAQPSARWLAGAHAAKPSPSCAWMGASCKASARLRNCGAVSTSRSPALTRLAMRLAERSSSVSPTSTAGGSANADARHKTSTIGRATHGQLKRISGF